MPYTDKFERTGTVNDFMNRPLANNQWNLESNEQAEAGVFERFFNPGIASREQLANQMLMMGEEQNFQEYMFNLANEYNSPQAQMERFKEAGINPMLAASGIAGTGNATATPMTGGGGSAGLNTSNENPFKTIEGIANAFMNGINGTNTLGTLLGFGKQNKANIEQIRETTKKIKTEANLNTWQAIQLRKLLPHLERNAILQGDEIEQNIKNLQELLKVYKEQQKNIAEDTTLKNAQTGEIAEKTKNLQYQNFREEFKKNFRDLFGIELNESDISMLVQLIMGGKGENVVAALGGFVRSILHGSTNEAATTIKDVTNGVKDAHQTFLDYKNKIETKNRYKKKERIIKRAEEAYDKNPEYYKKIGYPTKQSWVKAVTEHGKGHYSGRW